MNSGSPVAPVRPPPAYRRATRRTTAILLLVWFAVTFGVGFFARDLQFHVFGWPFSFWVGAQGGLVVYVAITWWYARTMRRLDRAYGIGDDGLPRSDSAMESEPPAPPPGSVV